jgi:hypothetical protein
MPTNRFFARQAEKQKRDELLLRVESLARDVKEYCAADRRRKFVDVAIAAPPSPLPGQTTVR